MPDDDGNVVGLELLSDEELRAAALSNWIQLNQVLRRASPALVHRLLKLELRSESPREQLVSRLYGKLAKRRALTERRLLLNACSDPVMGRDKGDVVLERLVP